MKSKRVVKLEISVNNLMAILDILEAYETEFSFRKIDFQKFLKYFAWTFEEYEDIYLDIEHILTKEEFNEQINYNHTWDKMF